LRCTMNGRRSLTSAATGSAGMVFLTANQVLRVDYRLIVSVIHSV
jgi:hypothetical protein